MTFIAQQVLEDAKYVLDKLGKHPTRAGISKIRVD